MVHASLESMDMLQTLSEKHGIGILNVECAVLLSESEAATAEVATAVNFCPGTLRID